MTSELNTQVVKEEKQKHYCIAIDVSGSMHYSLESIREHLGNQIATSLAENDLLSIIYYSSNGDFGLILDRFIYKGIDSLMSAKNAVKMLKSRNLTGFCDPLKLAKKTFTQSETNIFIFMSDGYENQNSITSVLNATSDLASVVDYGIVIEYGDYANHDLLLKMGDILGTTIYAKNVQTYNIQLDTIVKGTYSSNTIKIPSTDIEQIFFVQDGLTVVPKLVDNEYIIPIDLVYYVVSFNSNYVPAKEISQLNQGLLGLCYINESKPSKVWEYLGQLGSISLIDQYSGAIGNQKLNEFQQKLLSYIVAETELFEGGFDLNYLPPSNEFNLIDLLQLLSEDEETKVYTRDDRFNYSKIGSSKVQTSTLDEENPYKLDYEYVDLIEKGNPLELVYNSSRANISFQVNHKVSVDLTPVINAKKLVGLPEKVETIIFRNYTIVADLILNLKQMVVTTSEETLKIIPTDLYEIVNGRVVLFLDKLSLTNRDMIASVDMEAFAEQVLDDKMLAYRQRVFNSLSKENEVKSYSNPFVEKYGEEVANQLSELGIGNNGFSPKVVSVSGQDMYYAPEITTKVAGIQSVPSLDNVIKKVNEKGEAKLTPGETILYGIYKEYLTFISMPHYVNSADQKALLISYLETEQKSIRKVKRNILYNLSKSIFVALLSKQKIDNDQYEVTKENNKFSITIDQKVKEVLI